VPHPSFARVGKHEPRPESEGAEAFRPRKKSQHQSRAFRPGPLPTRCIPQAEGYGLQPIRRLNPKFVILNGARLGPHGCIGIRGVSGAKDLLLFFAMLQSPQQWVPHPSFARVGKHEPRPESEGAEAFRPRKKASTKAGPSGPDPPPTRCLPQAEGYGLQPVYKRAHLFSIVILNGARLSGSPRTGLRHWGDSGPRSDASAMGVSGVKACPELVEGDLLFAQLRSARKWVPRSLP
jgi:hypothetical protein